MYKYICLVFFGLIITTSIIAQEEVPSLNTYEVVLAVSAQPSTAQAPPKAGKFVLGGYGEAVAQRMWYTDDVARYAYPETHKGDTHGRFDLPHVVLYMGYEFGKGWRLSSEIEFEHGGSGSAYEVEYEEAGEYEHETEKGGEVALEQFWIEKTFSTKANLRMGHIIIPIGLTNAHHLPTEFFSVLRPEEESALLPCTWHQTGISFWGLAGPLRYEALVTSGLDAERISSSEWIHGAALSPYEFEIGNAYAGAARLDYTLPKLPLRIGLSGYLGASALNSLKWKRYDNKNLKGIVAIGDLDAVFDNGKLIARANLLYGHLSDSYALSLTNKGLPSAGPGARTNVASEVLSYYIEAGYDLLNLFHANQCGKLYLYGHYGFYDSMYGYDSRLQKQQGWYRKHIYAGGLNYYPLPQIVVKAEYTFRQFEDKYNYNNEPTLSLGIAYSGLFIK
ncbi:MAG: OprO/OprP family phosphate-selective porin [Tannerellaceae bacterium]|jgi:hypothetical protein|nr:OprO/OprP family phosphate-selective porin [Tannerellaceae bacterium]